VSNHNTDYVKACLSFILYGTHLKGAAVKAIVYTGFQKGFRLKSVLDGFGKVLYLQHQKVGILRCKLPKVKKCNSSVHCKLNK